MIWNMPTTDYYQTEQQIGFGRQVGFVSVSLNCKGEIPCVVSWGVFPEIQKNQRYKVLKGSDLVN